MASENWKARLTPLEKINWSKKNPEWDNVCIVANSAVSDWRLRAATKAFIKAKLGIALSDGEQLGRHSPKNVGWRGPELGLDPATTRLAFFVLVPMADRRIPARTIVIAVICGSFTARGRAHEGPPARRETHAHWLPLRQERRDAR